MSAAQQLLERICYFIGKPIFLVLIFFFVAFWIASNLVLPHYLIMSFDPPPFHFLQGIIGLSALLTSIIVVSNQNRLAKLAEQRAHLDLKVNLLTEQKTAKMIDLLEKLRFDLPNVRNSQDSDATELKNPIRPTEVLAALGERTAMDALQQPKSSPSGIVAGGHK